MLNTARIRIDYSIPGREIFLSLGRKTDRIFSIPGRESDGIFSLPGKESVLIFSIPGWKLY